MLSSVSAKPQRIVYLDILRITAIFAMIFLHVASSNWENVSINTFEWQVFNVYGSAVRFCVPVFVMISGAMFLNNSRIITIEKLFKKNIFRIITAYLFWSTVYSLFVALYFVLQSQPITLVDVIDNIIFGHYHLWFLFTLVGLYLATPLLRKITESKKLAEYYLLLSFVFCFVVNFINITNDFIASYVKPIIGKANLGFFSGYAALFVLGYYLYNTDISKKIRIIIYISGFASVIFTMIATDMRSASQGVASQAFYSYLLPTTLLTSCAIFLLFKYGISTIKFSDKSVSFIYLCAKHTFGIYLVHELIIRILNAVNLSTLAYNPILSVPINSIIVFVVSFLIVHVLSKIPVINKYII